RVAVQSDRFVRPDRLLVCGQRLVPFAHPHEEVAEIDMVVRIGFALGHQVAHLLDGILDLAVAYEILGLPLGYGAHLRRRSPIPWPRASASGSLPVIDAESPELHANPGGSPLRASRRRHEESLPAERIAHRESVIASS